MNCNIRQYKRGISAIFVLVMLLFMLIIGLSFLMVANLGRKNAASTGRLHAAESGRSSTDRVINRLKYDLIGNNKIAGDMTYILSNPDKSETGNIEALNEYTTAYSGIPAVNLKDRGNQYAEMMGPASDEPYDYPYSNGDRAGAWSNISGLGMEDDSWLSSSRPTAVYDSNGDLDYWRWDHMTDIRESLLIPYTRIFAGYYRKGAAIVNDQGQITGYEKIDTNTKDANGNRIYKILPGPSDGDRYDKSTRDERVWRSDKNNQWYLVDEGNTIDQLLPDRSPFLVNVRPNTTANARQASDFTEHRIPDPRRDGYYNLASGSTTSPNKADGIPDYEAFMPDADGDGIPDSRWMWAPMAQVRDMRYVMAVRVVDLSSKININLSKSVRNSMSPYAYTGAPNYVHTHIDKSLLVNRLESSLYSSPSTILSGISSGQPTSYDNYRAMYNGTSVASGWDLLDEMFLRHGGFISSFQDRTALIKDVNAAPFLNYSDRNLSSAYLRLGTAGSYASTSWNRILDEMTDISRNPKDAFTTISGAIDIAPFITLKSVGDNRALTRDSSDEIVNNIRLKKDLSDIVNSMNGDRYDMVRAIQYELKEVWKHAEDGGKTPYWLRSTLGAIVNNNVAYDDIDSWTMRMALSIMDYFDQDNIISIHDSSYDGAYVGGSGFEMKPFISEVLVVKPYDISSHTPDAGGDPTKWTVDASWIDDEVGLVIEIKNPYSRTINLSNTKLFIGDVELVADLKDTTADQELDPNESLIIYLNTEVPEATSSTDVVADKDLYDNGLNDQILRAKLATYTFGVNDNTKKAISDELKKDNVEIYLSAKGIKLEDIADADWANINTGIVDPSDEVWIKYQSIRITDHGNDYIFPDNGDASLSGIPLELNAGSTAPDSANARHKLFRRFNYLGNANGWKMMMLQGVNGHIEAPRWRREMNANRDGGDKRGPYFAGLMTDNRFSLDHKYVEFQPNGIDGKPDHTKDVNEFFSSGNTVLTHTNNQILNSDHKNMSNTAQPAIRRLDELLYVNFLGPGVSGNSNHPKAINDILEKHVEYWRTGHSYIDYLSPDYFRFDMVGDKYIRVNANNGNLEKSFRTIYSKTMFDTTDASYNTVVERDTFLQRDQVNYLQVPPIHILLSRLSTSSPYKGLFTYTYEDLSVDGLVDNCILKQDSSKDDIKDNLIRHGAININTVDKQTLISILPGLYNFNSSQYEKIADAIIKYRDNPKVDSSGRITSDGSGKHYRVAPLNEGGLGLPVTWRGGRYDPANSDFNPALDLEDSPPALPGGKPGIANLSELAVVFNRIMKSGNTHIFPFGTATDDYDITKIDQANDYLRSSSGTDRIIDDVVERTALYGMMSEMFVTRSDFYVVYVLLRGFTYDSGSSIYKLGDLVEQKRYVYIIDRASLFTGDDKNIRVLTQIAE